MEEEKSNLETLHSESRQGSGSMLAAARKDQNRTIEEIAQELNLSVSLIKTIELDQTEGLPESTYVRGYIRSYAKLLGLKPEEVLHNYLNPDWQKSSSLNDIPRGIGAAEETPPSFFRPSKFIVLAVIALLVAAPWYYGALANLFGFKKQNTQAIPVATVASDVDDESSDDRGKELTPDFDNAGESTVGTPTDEMGAGESSRAKELGQAGDADTALTDAIENVLLINFTETSWVDIRDVEDDRRVYKSYAQGEQLQVREAGVLKVFIGNAAGVEVELNGQPFDIEPHREGVYAKFEIDPSQ